ncbi:MULTISPECIES: flagellar basal body-associated FliL family protein [unclassified Dinoroseobacter]|uniref:flagellar basal body-associated FliL family protein n=1 Tax=unclassified Dinoroseobacter TaxID=2620028 RepID=UPI003C79A6D5
MAKLLPVILLIIGLAGGGAAGYFLRPPPPPPPEPDTAEVEEELPKLTTEETYDQNANYEYVKLNNQFVVPVVRDGRVASLVVMSITLEVTNGVRADIYAREPRIRDALLAVLFDHSNSGGFDGVFTESFTLKTLRVALREAARSMIGEDIKDVLVMDIVRQDVI